MNSIIHIGTRGSQLALWQTNWVKERLQKQFPEFRFDSAIIKTTGDKILNVPLSNIGDKGLFTKELDNALIRGDVDFAVHSLKDLPTEIPSGLMIGAITQRWDVRDALVANNGATLDTLPEHAAIATGSLRRKAQLLAYRPDFRIVDIRGNLNTRFKKFDESDWDAMILAVAGIERLGWHQRISEKIATDIMLPAVGQGSFAVICREGDERILSLLQAVNDEPAALAATAERAMLKTLEGGCQIPIGALAEIKDSELQLRGCVCQLDGKVVVRERKSIQLNGRNDRAAADQLGSDLAALLLQNGAGEILSLISAEMRA